jgi:hypothetical protein
MYMDVLYSEAYEVWGGGTSMLVSYETGGVLCHVQHLTKILVELSGWIPPVKIYSNKEISQLSKFSTKRTSSTRQFQKFVRTF